MTSNKPNKLAFLSMPAPASYVAGLGRGASGFTTRSDIGPAREGPSAEVIAEAQAKRGEEPEIDPEQFQDPDNEYGLFAGATYEQDDEEADQIYAKVDENMDSRRRVRREARENAELAKHRSERPKIQQQFADLKRGLSVVTDEEWENIPEVGNLTRKKRRRDERSFVVPDSIIVGDRTKTEYENALDPVQQQTGGLATPAELGEFTNFVEIGQARDKLLSLKLDQISGVSSTSGSATSVDPKGYLTSLNSVVLKTEAEIGDIKRARMLYDSLVKSNPKHAPGWIAAACLEEHAGRMVAARKLILAGCEQCPKSEDVWLEAARLHSDGDAKVILADAVQHIDHSVKIWLAAADLESDPPSKKRVLRKALEHIPNSVRLWKEAVNLEDSQTDARILLARAVELIPLAVDLWLALARVETPERARAVLNKAHKAVQTSHEIWIAAGRLMEQEAMSPAKSSEQREKDLNMLDKTVEHAVGELRRNQVMLTREQWLKQAEDCEAQGSPRTCEAIVKATVAMDIDEEDRVGTWIGDAEAAQSKGRFGTARAVWAYALKVFPDRKDLWQEAAALEKAHGTKKSLEAVLQQAVLHCPQAEALWLMAAKEKWLAGDVPAARQVLERAFIANPESEEIWLAAVKLEAKNGELAVARQLLVRARTVADTERIWMKSAVFERQLGHVSTALETLSLAISKFPKFAKLYMIQGQIHQSRQDYAAARASFAAGLKACPKEVALWILASRLEETDGKSIKARALLERGRLVNPANETLWMEAVGVEERSGGMAQAKAMLARALQDCPSSGPLWALAIWQEPRPTRRSKSVDALKKSQDHPVVRCAVARLFWTERKIEKARSWFDRALMADPSLGDSWGWWFKFEKEYGTQEQRDQVIKKCLLAEPRYGPVWQSIAKDFRNAEKSTRELLGLVSEALLH